MSEQTHTPLTEKKEEKIALSPTSETLLKAVSQIKYRHKPDEFSKIHVSQAVSFLGLVYEKVRTAIEYMEEHLIRRAAIERIMKRRLAMNPKGDGEGENLLRELLWARYFENGSLGDKDADTIQKIIDKYLDIKSKLLTGRPQAEKVYLAQFLIDLFSCEIEETLTPGDSNREAVFNYFIFQILRNKVEIQECTPEQKDAYLLIALEKAFRKSDVHFQRYHLFNLFYKPLGQSETNEADDLIGKLPSIFKKIDGLIHNPTVDKLTKFSRKQLPPFLILFEIIRTKKIEEVRDIFSNKDKLWTEVEMMCRNKYQQTKSRLQGLAFRSLIYIFVTKMILALILEVPVSNLLYGEVSMLAIGVNTLFPPLVMLVILLTTKIPGEDNTKRVFERIEQIIDEDESYEKEIAFITKSVKAKKPTLIFGFTILYTLTFVVTLWLIHLALNLIYFNILSQALFIFFISVVTFFSYRIKQIAKEYRLIEKDSIFKPLTDFFFMPILSLGKIFSQGVSKLNVFTFIFDFIIEAPFKLIIEVIEEWISFVRARKEEIM